MTNYILTLIRIKKMNKACLDSPGFWSKNQWGPLLCQDYHYSLQKKLYPPNRHIVRIDIFHNMIKRYHYQTFNISKDIEGSIKLSLCTLDKMKWTLKVTIIDFRRIDIKKEGKLIQTNTVTFNIPKTLKATEIE